MSVKSLNAITARKMILEVETREVWEDNDTILAHLIVCNHELLNNGDYPSMGEDTLDTAKKLNTAALKLRDALQRLERELGDY